MSTPAYGIIYSAQLSGSAVAGLAGDVLIPDATTGLYTNATTANRGTRRSTGVALTAYAAGGTVSIQQFGQLDAATARLSSGTASWVRVSTTGALERVTPSGSDDVVGWCETDGTLHCLFGVLTAAITTGGGTVPSGTGYRHITGGAEDAAAVALTWTGDATGTGTGSSFALTVVKVNGAAVPAAGALTTGNSAYVSGASALTYSALNLAGGAGWISGTLPEGNGGTGFTAFGAGVAAFLQTPSSANLATALTDETGSGALVFGTAPLFKTTINLNNPGNTFKYVITPAAIAADRILTLPLLAGNDVAVCEAFTQTLTNKTIAGASNTLSVRIANDVTGLGSNVAAALAAFSSANIKTACTDETGTGGALVFATSPTLTTPVINGQTQGAAIAMGASAIDWSLGNVFTKTLAAGANTFTFSNQASGMTIMVRVTGAASTLTWPTVKWAGGAAPTQTASGTDVYTFVHDGTNVYGSVVQSMS